MNRLQVTFFVVSSVLGVAFLAGANTQHRSGNAPKSSERTLDQLDSKIRKKMSTAFVELRVQHKRAVGKLIKLAKSENVNQDYRGPKHRAIKLLGRWRERNAVDVLTKALDYVPRNFMFEREISDQRMHVAAAALVRIGRPAVGHMVREIRQARDEQHRGIAGWVMLKVLGRKAAIQRLATLADQEPELANRLNQTASYIKNFEPTYEKLKQAVNKVAGEELYDIRDDRAEGGG